MKKINLLLLILISTIFLNACTVSKNGQIKLKLPPPPKKKTTTNTGTKPNTNGTNGTNTVNANGVRYKDYIFATTSYSKETYATNVPTWNGGQRNIGIEIFAPQGDNLKNRPCVMFMFGGGWAARMADGIDEFMKSFAQKGYVAISVDYRIGFPKSDGVFLCTANTDKDMREAMCRATQDAFAAVRYVKANAERLGIDKNLIFIGGGSAGGSNALNVAYMDENDVPNSIQQNIGKLNSVGGNQEQNTNIAGVFSFAGPVVQKDMLENKNIPTLLFQGQCDELIPFNEGVAFPFCSMNKNYMSVYGHEKIFEILKNNGTPVRFNVVCNGGHDAFGWGKEKLVIEVSDFMVDVMNKNFKTEKKILIPNTKKCPNQKFPDCIGQ